MKRKAAHLKSYTIVMGLFVSSVILGIMYFFAVAVFYRKKFQTGYDE